MQTFYTVLRISLAVLGGWFVIVLWFLLLNVSKSPVNQFLLNSSIVPLMTHSNNGGVLDSSHWFFVIQSILVFPSGGLLSALIAKDRELLAASILSLCIVITCIFWDSNINCKFYYAIDLFIWLLGVALIMISGFTIQRKRLIDFILHRIIKGNPANAVKSAARPQKNPPAKTR